MKRYRVLRDCSGFKTLNCPRTKWKEGELVWFQDNERPPIDSFVKVSDSVNTYSGVQIRQRELVVPKAGFAKSLDESKQSPKKKR